MAIEKPLANGDLPKALERSLAAREKAVASRRRIFTGTNQYANLREKALDRIEPTVAPDAHRRGAKSFERLRLRTERHAAMTGKTATGFACRNRGREDEVGALRLRR